VLDFWFCQILTQVNIFLEAKKTNATLLNKQKANVSVFTYVDITVRFKIIIKYAFVFLFRKKNRKD
jgi:hypothetical protein